MPDMDDASGSASGADPSELMDGLEATFRQQVERALGTALDGSVTSLALVDHYLAKARPETRAPIVTLLAAGAGAYFARLVERELGAIHVGSPTDPRRARTLLTGAFLYFSPVDLAYEAIAGQSLSPDDERIAPGPPLDTAFHLDETDPAGDDDLSEAEFVDRQLGRVAPLSEEEFHSLTGRFETLTYIAELLAHRARSRDQPPRRLTVQDYLTALARADAESPS